MASHAITPLLSPLVLQSEEVNLQDKFKLSMDVHEVGELGYEVSKTNSARSQETAEFYEQRPCIKALRLVLNCEKLPGSFMDDVPNTGRRP